MADFDKDYSLFESAVSQQNNLFTLEKYSETLAGSGDTAVTNFLKRIRLRSNGNMVDIRNGFKWRNSSEAQDDSVLNEVPSLILEEKTLAMRGIAATISNVINTFRNVIDTAQNESFEAAMSEPYAQLYVIEQNNSPFKYRIPWLLNSGSNLRSITNTWNDNKGFSPRSSSSSTGAPNSKLSQFFGGAIGGAAGFLTPGIEVDPIYTFSTTNCMTLNIRFPLYNTFNIQSTIDNFYFTILLTYQNLKNRTSLVTYVPPSVYTVSCEGMNGVYMPIAYMRELKINNIGTVRQITDDIIPGKTVLVPEAYDVNITLQEMLPQSTNIFQGAVGGAKVEVVGTNPFGGGPNTRGGPE
jgi:hypothetical protein